MKDYHLNNAIKLTILAVQSVHVYPKEDCGCNTRVWNSVPQPVPVLTCPSYEFPCYIDLDSDVYK